MVALWFIGYGVYLLVSGERSEIFPAEDPRADTEQEPLYIDSRGVERHPEWICPDDPSWEDYNRCEYIITWLEEN